MKTFTQLTLAVTLAATATASSHHHGHRHLHAKKDATKVDKRQPEVVTEVVVQATELVYQLGDKFLDGKDAEKGIANGEYVIVGESTPTYSAPPAPSSTKDLGAQFIETKTTSPPPPPPTTTSTPPPPPSSTAQAPVANAAASSDDDSTSSASGEGRDFPSGKIKCGHFPSDYGAVPIPWMGLGKGWAGIQKVPGGILAQVYDNIVTGITGEDCTPGAFCNYACKSGSQMMQWPSLQGSTGQSIGGLYCNDDGYLELTRPSFKRLCEEAEGGVVIQNDLVELVSICKTLYPGTESMVIPTVAQPGQQIPVTNPNQETYYKWKDMKTTSQYYINPKGVKPEDACVWKSSTCPDRCGNWAPINLGVGMDNGVTYVSIFQNLPTSNAQLDFNIELMGGNSACKYENGQWSSGSSTGCTTAAPKGQTITVRFY
ncbi:hypothetical protein PWT90_00001 [Aphanocladium album]|nr:hypothetical protein PWT90_00001 [Aphanocladium album]